LRVTGNESPLNANSVVDGLADVMVTLPPLADNVPVWVALAPTTTLPKSMLPGLTARFPAAGVDPESAMGTVGLAALDVKVKLPFVDPLVCGVNMTEKVKLCPAVRVWGKFNPLVLNAEEDIAAFEMLTLAPPVLVSV
jgi:hypothetical protein